MASIWANMWSILRVHSNHSLCLSIHQLFTLYVQYTKTLAVKKWLSIELICAVNIVTLNSGTVVTWYKSECTLSKMHPAQPRFARLGGVHNNSLDTTTCWEKYIYIYLYKYKYIYPNDQQILIPLKYTLRLKVILKELNLCIPSLTDPVLPGLFYKQSRDWLINSLTHSLTDGFPKISLCPRLAPTVWNGAFSHIIDYIRFFLGNSKSWRTSKLHNCSKSYRNYDEQKWIFPIGQSGEASQLRVCYQPGLSHLVYNDILHHTHGT